MVSEKLNSTRDVLQLRHVHVQIHPIDAFHFHCHVLIQDLGHRLCYLHARFVRQVLPLRRRLDRSFGPILGGDSVDPVMNRRTEHYSIFSNEVAPQTDEHLC